MNDDILIQLKAENTELTAQRDALLAACEQAYRELGKDWTWRVSSLRLSVLRPAIEKAGGKVVQR